MKKVLITGAGSGLGHGTALGLVQAGHDVIATTQIWPDVTELRRQVAELGRQERVTVEKLDVLDRRDIEAAVTWDFDTFVSNAGIGESGPMAEIPVDLVRRTFETNVFSNLELTQHVVRKFLDGNTAGRVVIVSSIGRPAHSLRPRRLLREQARTRGDRGEPPRRAGAHWDNGPDDQPRTV